jgi:hypothetical protein
MTINSVLFVIKQSCMLENKKENFIKNLNNKSDDNVVRYAITLETCSIQIVLYTTIRRLYYKLHFLQDPEKL